MGSYVGDVSGEIAATEGGSAAGKLILQVEMMNESLECGGESPSQI